MDGVRNSVWFLPGALFQDSADFAFGHIDLSYLHINTLTDMVRVIGILTSYDVISREKIESFIPQSPDVDKNVHAVFCKVDKQPEFFRGYYGAAECLTDFV